MAEDSTRDLIVEAADRLFYQRGYDHTSFTDIAGIVKISRGNFYYHFKTKDDILAAVIDRRLRDTRAMLDGCDTAATPAARLRRFTHMLVTNRIGIMRHGCPTGTLCTELAKLEHGAFRQAGGVFGLIQGWLARQFALLGQGAQSGNLALHLLSRVQGIATLATALRDEAFIGREVARIDEWLATLSPE